MLKAIVPRLVRPITLVVLLFAAAWIAAHEPARAVASAPTQPVGHSQVVGEGPNRAAIAVRFGDGRVEARCVAFSEDNIGGGDLLERSGLIPAISPEGAVCSIEAEGCPTDNCFCLCQNFDDCQYWAFYQWRASGWVYSQFGVMANSVIVSDGTLHGWSWGAGDTTTGARPPDMTYEQICMPASESSQISMARTQGESGQAPAAKAKNSASSGASGNEQLAESRSFSPQLLPGYVECVVAVVVLLGMAWYTLRRRSGRLVTPEPGEAESGAAGRE